MDAQFQRELNDVITKVKKLGPSVVLEAKKDLTEAAGLLAASLKGATPVSNKPHAIRGNVYTPGTSRRAMKVLPLRRAKTSAFVGPSFRASKPPFYIKFIERGTRHIKARRFIERTAEQSGPIAQDIAIKLLLRRIGKFEKENFK